MRRRAPKRALIAVLVLSSLFFLSLNLTGKWDAGWLYGAFLTITGPPQKALNWAEKKVEDVMSRKMVVTYPDETLEDALIKLVERDIGRLPVVERKDERKLVGLITRSDIVKAHAREVAKLLEA